MRLQTLGSAFAAVADKSDDAPPAESPVMAVSPDCAQIQSPQAGEKQVRAGSFTDPQQLAGTLSSS